MAGCIRRPFRCIGIGLEHGQYFDYYSPKAGDENPFDEDMAEEEEQKMQKELELDVPLDAPWTKTKPSIFERKLQLGPGREEFVDPSARMQSTYWSMLQAAHKQRRNHVVRGGQVLSFITVRRAIAHDPKNPYGYWTLAKWLQEDGDLHAAGGYYALCAERARPKLPAQIPIGCGRDVGRSLA